jgi:hypothetical protein
MGASPLGSARSRGLRVTARSGGRR